MNSPDNQPLVFKTLVRRALELKEQIDKTLISFKSEAESIQNYYAPRAEFNRWRQSSEGKAWKAGKWSKQKERCAECKCDIPLKGSHIDRIKPLSIYPELSLTLANLRITCPECNVRRGNRELETSSP